MPYRNSELAKRLKQGSVKLTMKAKGLAVFGAVLLAAIALLVYLDHRAARRAAADLIAQQVEQLRIANQIAQDAAAAKARADQLAALERDLAVGRELLNSQLSQSADRVRDIHRESAERIRDIHRRSAERRQQSIEEERLAEMRRANEIADQLQQTLERTERNSRNNALRIR